MDKVYINSADEDWIVDKFKHEFLEFNSQLITPNIQDANIIWIISPWTWKQLPKEKLKSKKVIVTIHHLDDSDLSPRKIREFRKRDKFVDAYHIITAKTLSTLQELTQKKIYNFPFWVNQDNFFNIENSTNIKSKYNIPQNSYLVGSFQRDSEGKNLNKPKLIKGPDIFIKALEVLNYKFGNLHIVLSGYRRNYVMNKLDDLGISYSYFEKANIGVINELYNCLDLYMVTSRIEGGPQAIFECAITKTPIISTDVGIANKILHPRAIFSINDLESAAPNVEYAYQQVQEYLIPDGFNNFKTMFNEVST
jgi:glycosyltransferase involved in cell wall biosynthesis